MQNTFNSSAAQSLSEAEQALKSWGIGYEKQPDGSLLVPGHLDISMRGLTSLPDLRKVKLGGSFDCSNNPLTSLEGAPQSVGGDFFCSDSQLTSLEGAPQIVGGGFYCSDSQLTSLEGAPQIVGGGFYCHSNQLASLEHAPHTVSGDFFCHDNRLASLEHAPHTVSGDFSCFNNQLASLEHAPQSVGGDFYCHDNRLTSLEGAPQSFKKLHSDFGEVPSWDAVPEELRSSPETRERLEEERQAKAIQAATVLEAPLRIGGTLKFKSLVPA